MNNEELLRKKKEHEEKIRYADERWNQLVLVWESAFSNFITISGMIATGALVLLASEVVVSNEYLVAGGVVVLLLEVVLICWYLVNSLSRDDNNLKKKYRELLEDKEFIKFEIAYGKGEITEESFNQHKIIKEKIDIKRAEEYENNQRKDVFETPNLWDKVFVALLTLGIGLIAYGIFDQQFIKGKINDNENLQEVVEERVKG